MSRQKWLYLVVAVLCVVVVLVSGCGPTAEERPPLEEEEGWVPPIPGMKPGEEDLYIEWQATQGSRNVTPGLDYVPLEIYWQKIEELTGGRMKLSSYNWGYSVASTFEAPFVVGANIVQYGGSVPTYHPIEMPLGQIYMMPGGCPSDDLWDIYELFNFMTSHPAYIESLHRMNLHPMPNQSGEPMYLMVRKGIGRELHKPEDFEGLLVRAAGYQLPWYEALGGTTVVCSIFEVYEFMQKGMADVAATTIFMVQTFQFSEVCESVMDYSPLGGGGLNWCNLDAWNDLPEYIQDIMLNGEAPQAFVEYYIDDKEIGIELGYETMEEKGINFYHVTPEEQVLLMEPAGAAWETFVTEVEQLSNGKRVREFTKDYITKWEEIAGREWTIYNP